MTRYEFACMMFGLFGFVVMTASLLIITQSQVPWVGAGTFPAGMLLAGGPYLPWFRSNR